VLKLLLPENKEVNEYLIVTYNEEVRGLCLYHLVSGVHKVVKSVVTMAGCVGRMDIIERGSVDLYRSPSFLKIRMGWAFRYDRYCIPSNPVIYIGHVMLLGS
jgi:hypothetical protein